MFGFRILYLILVSLEATKYSKKQKTSREMQKFSIKKSGPFKLILKKRILLQTPVDHEQKM